MKNQSFLAIEVPTYIEEGYYDSDGDVLYLERLLIDDTTHDLFSEVLFDREPQCFKDESEFDTLKNMVKTFDPGIYEKTFSPSCVRLSSKDHHYLFFTIAKLRRKIRRRKKNDRVDYELDAKQGLFRNLKSSCRVRRSGAQGCKAWRPSCIAWCCGQGWWSGGQDVGVVPKGAAWGKRGGSISPDSFLSSILLVVMVVIVVVTVILVVVVVAIIGVVIVVTIFKVVVVVIVGGVPSIIKLSFVIVGSLHRTML
ncbi:hypothetical protein Tco_0826684 [Tanacetum coccineum]